MISAVHCTSRTITPAAVCKELKTMMDIRTQDMVNLLENNMAEIIAAAKKGRN